MHGEDQDEGARETDFDVLEEFDAVAAFERDVGDDEVRAEFLESIEGFVDIFGGAADHEVFFLVDHFGEPLADDGVIIHE
jgi:hypothetical protein